MISKYLYKYTLVLFSIFPVSYSFAVEPIQNQYSNVFPELSHQALEVFRSNDIDGPWYISFNLLSPANVHVGAQAFNETNGTTCCFNISSIRIVTIEGDNVAFGTDVITDNPFPEPIEHLVSVENLAAGNYAIEVSGSGNREQLTFAGKTEASDFITRLSVTSGNTPINTPSVCLQSTYDSSTGVLHIPNVLVDVDRQYEVQLGSPYNILSVVPK